MHEIKIKQWDSEYGGAPSLEAIQAMFSPPEKFRVSLSRIWKNQVTQDSTFEGNVFVLRGSVTYSSQNTIVTLKAGEFAFIPTGSYRFETGPDEDLEMVKVFNLNDLFESACK